ncbi:hypothetical protein AYI69_g6695 [Smittium culicis]|uniref:Uncharacterized protein n=1 Tax=Smittium culicis TaxID=133412 RepID=A0A1R1XXF3_9FUNG|nr:hypothetical protein AYI69_g6695 [Smittium culicis]
MLKRRYKEKIPADPLYSLNRLVLKGTSSEDFLAFVDELEYEAKKVEKHGELTKSKKSKLFVKALPS